MSRQISSAHYKTKHTHTLFMLIFIEHAISKPLIKFTTLGHTRGPEGKQSSITSSLYTLHHSDPSPQILFFSPFHNSSSWTPLHPHIRCLMTRLQVTNFVTYENNIAMKTAARVSPSTCLLIKNHSTWHWRNEPLEKPATIVLICLNCEQIFDSWIFGCAWQTLPSTTMIYHHHRHHHSHWMQWCMCVTASNVNQHQLSHPNQIFQEYSFCLLECCRLFGSCLFFLRSTGRVFAAAKDCLRDSEITKDKQKMCVNM